MGAEMSSDGEDSTINTNENIIPNAIPESERRSGVPKIWYTLAEGPVHREEWRNEITERARFLILSEEERLSEDGQIMIRDFEERFRKAICESKQYGIFPPHTARNIGPPSRGLKPRSERNGGSASVSRAEQIKEDKKRRAKDRARYVATWKKRFKPLRIKPESISATKARAEAKRIAKETWKKRFKPLRLRQK